MKTALITGDQGFVARHMRPVLEGAGYTVTGFDVKPGTIAPRNRHTSGIAYGVRMAALDARDYFRNSEQYFDLVIHLAAVVGGRAKIEGAPLDLAVDLSIDAEMFSWAIRTRPKKVVYFSSSAAYPIGLQRGIIAANPDGSAKSRALREADIDLDDIQTPDLTYGWAKLTGEMLAKHAQAAGLDVLVVRPFSGYAEDQDLDYPFPSFIARAKERADVFDIWGSGTQCRDWIHIDDVCRATLALVDAGVQTPTNLGTGIATSFDQLALMVNSASDHYPEYNHILDAPKGVHYRIADPTNLFCYYQPEITIQQGIAMALSK